MNTGNFPIEDGRSSSRGEPSHYGISNTHTNSAMSNNVRGNSNTNVGNVSNSYNNTINVGVNEETKQIQAWLSPVEPHIRHQDVRNRRLDGVGEWVLGRSEFKEWCGGQGTLMDPTLLCYGVQGVGKTYISSLAIDALRHQARGQNIAVLSLYSDYQAQKDQSTVNMIGGLVRQVAVGTPSIPNAIKSAFEESKKRDGQSLRLPEMVELLIEVISCIDRVFICIDAIDELLPQVRSEFLRALRKIIADAPNTRLFLTSRPYVRTELDKHLTTGSYVIPIVVNQEDIAQYVRQKIDEDGDRDPDLMTENLRNDILKTVSEKASEMFLLVALNIDAILGETSIGGRKEMLEKVATTGVDLDTVYTRTLQRIKEQKGGRSRLGVEVLMWVSHSQRPMQIDELCHALAVKMGSTDLDPDNIRPQDTVLGSCLGLVMIDKETSVVRLIHYTLQEYLSGPSILPGVHATLAETCLTFLNYMQIRTLPANKPSDLHPADMPFLQYASLYWAAHAKNEFSDRVKLASLELLNQYDGHISGAIILNSHSHFFYKFFTPRLFTGLHCAAYFGIFELVAALIEAKCCDVNQGDSRGLTPLAWAARQGHDGVVGLLLTRGDVNPDKPDNNGQTPLLQAASSGHESVVQLLLTPDNVNPDKPDNRGRVPLWWAVYFGHESVVRLLLTRDDVNPDRPNNYGQTPLLQAASSGHENMVRLLLTRDGVNPNKPDNYGQTPLWQAAYFGHESVVRLLLSRDDVNPNKPDNYGQTPLWLGTYFGHESLVRLLTRTM